MSKKSITCSGCKYHHSKKWNEHPCWACSKVIGPDEIQDFYEAR